MDWSVMVAQLGGPERVASTVTPQDFAKMLVALRNTTNKRRKQNGVGYLGVMKIGFTRVWDWGAGLAGVLKGPTGEPLACPARHPMLKEYMERWRREEKAGEKDEKAAARALSRQGVSDFMYDAAKRGERQRILWRAASRVRGSGNCSQSNWTIGTSTRRRRWR